MEKETCPKCRGEVIGRTYCNGRFLGCGVSNRVAIANQGEHMDRACQSCGYTWAEPCADRDERIPWRRP